MNGNTWGWIRTGLALVALLGAGSLAFFDMKSDLRSQTEILEALVRPDGRIHKLELAVDFLRDRQAARVPLFDRMVDQVDRHELRLQQLERGLR